MDFLRAHALSFGRQRMPLFGRFLARIRPALTSEECERTMRRALASRSYIGLAKVARWKTGDETPLKFT